MQKFPGRFVAEFRLPVRFDNGLYCRADDRSEPVVQLSPLLIQW